MIAALFAYNGRFERIHEIICAVLVPTSIVVTTIFWALLSSPINDITILYADRANLVISHVLNIVPILIDVVSSKIKSPLRNIIYPTFYPAFYGIMLMSLRLISNEPWPYDFLTKLNGNIDKINYPIMLGVVVPVTCIIHGLLYFILIGIVKARDRLFRNHELPL
jgi:hypothetical protein